MTSLKGSHVLSVNQLDLDTLKEIFHVAKQMEPYAKRQKRTKVLEGAILANLFFEASTRTRVSFGTAFNLLGGSVRETVGMATSSLAKGESLFDTARMFASYSDVVAMRHPDSGSVAEFATGSSVPVINGGDGANEHPTQALLDLFTIEKELANNARQIDGMKIAMVGDLKHGRTVHSLSKLLCRYQNIEVTMISPKELAMPDYIIAELDNAGHKVTQTESLVDGLNDADIVYVTRIQEERFASQEEADQYRGQFRINKQIFTNHCQQKAVIMHPLPRDSRPQANELDNDLNEHPSLAVFRQADNGVLVRMALFAMTLGVEKQMSQYECPVNWHTNKA
ncbi:aspartate carbamoyltransferase [Paraferrimonas sp. SM1919]|uniref:aspartate carbamoyltransferase n=1 Tax=Paraferrimonas sp. SM1919 TaxID=2662263 RepID=UPI0013D4BE97|nr:aspartate carbamoyltransferase [Paraferrimonas sp. SM1919]